MLRNQIPDAGNQFAEKGVNMNRAIAWGSWCLGALTASIAHEINQPLASVRMNAGAGLRWLRAEPPNLEEVRQGLERIRRTAPEPST